MGAHTKDLARPSCPARRKTTTDSQNQTDCARLVYVHSYRQQRRSCRPKQPEQPDTQTERRSPMGQIHFIFDYLKEFNMVSVLLRLFLAVIVGGIIGFERGRHGSAAGFRTHILVCVGATMTSLCSLYASLSLQLPGDIFRLSAQVISGIGFLGAGIILVRNNSTVAGLTTAAGMWVTATIYIDSLFIREFYGVEIFYESCK